MNPNSKQEWRQEAEKSVELLLILREFIDNSGLKPIEVIGALEGAKYAILSELYAEAEENHG